MITASGRTRARTSLSHYEAGLIVAVLAVAVAVAVPEYLSLRQEAKVDSARTRLTQAAQALDQRQASVGTYAGALLPSGVVVHHAGRSSYCVETKADGRVWHVSPGVQPVSGAC